LGKQLIAGLGGLGRVLATAKFGLAPDTRTAHLTLGARELLGHPAHRLDRGLHAGHELLAEARGARLIPSLRLGEFLLGLRPEDDLTGQRARARAST
jgi:hypothetical protein